MPGSMYDPLEEARNRLIEADKKQLEKATRREETRREALQQKNAHGFPTLEVAQSEGLGRQRAEQERGDKAKDAALRVDPAVRAATDPDYGKDQQPPMQLNTPLEAVTPPPRPYMQRRGGLAPAPGGTLLQPHVVPRQADGLGPGVEMTDGRAVRANRELAAEVSDAKAAQPHKYQIELTDKMKADLEKAAEQHAKEPGLAR